MKSTLLFTALFFVAQIGLFGQSKVKLLDSQTKQPVSSAVVSIGQQGFSTLSDADGEVAIPMLEQGKYPLSISRLGYNEFKGELSYSDGLVSPAEIRLIPTELLYDDVEIVATRGEKRKSGFTFSNLTTKELEQKIAISDLPNVLKSLPSTTFYSEGGTGVGYSYIRLRGFDQRRVSVFINGVPQNGPEDHSVYWINFFDLASSLQDVQVQRGAGGSLSGTPSIGGSINLITKLPDLKPTLSFESGYGSFATKKFALEFSTGIISEHFAMSGRVSRIETAGYRNWSHSEYYRFFANAMYFDANQTFSLSAWGGPQRDGLAFYGIPKSYNSDATLRKSNYGERLREREYLHQPQINLNHTYKISENLILSNTVFGIIATGFFDFDGTWGTADYFRIPNSITIPNDLLIRSYVGNQQYGWLPRVTLKQSFGELTVGGELRYHRSIHWARIESGTGLEQYSGEKNDYRYYEYKGGKDIFALYAQQRWNVSEQLTATASLQSVYQTYSLFDESYVGTDFTTPYIFVNPQVGMNYQFSENATAYITAALTQREPPLANLYDAESASWGVTPRFEQKSNGTFDFTKPLVKPERLLNVELGSRLFLPNANISANVYYMNFQDEIVPSGGLDQYGQPRLGNAGLSYHAGIEVEGIYRPTSYTTFGGNIAWSKNIFVEFVEYETDALGAVLSQNRNNNAIPYSPEFIGNIFAEAVYEGALARLEIHHTGKFFTNNAQTYSVASNPDFTVEAFTLLAAQVEYTFLLSHTKITASLDIQNLTDAKVLTTGNGADNFFPAAERSYFASLKIGL